jgi:uncharacterized protein (TIGR02678 family)
MSNIDQIREREARGERQICVRALLQDPLLQAVGPHSAKYRLLRRHADWLRTWFSAEPAWPLVIEREYARLSKIPARLNDASFPARDHKGISFSRRRYALLCMVLAVLEKAERQTILGHIAEQVALKARGDEALERAGMDIRFERRAERLDLIAVIRILVKRGVLTRIHGDEEGYVQHSGEVLYTINRSVLSRVAVMQSGPSTLTDLPPDERAVRLHPSELFSEGDAARRRRSRTTLTRLLLDHPVVYYADLSEEELAYLHSQRARLTHEIEEASGEKFIRMEMGVPGLAPSSVGTQAEIAALKRGVASKYPMLDGVKEFKNEASRFVKAFMNLDVSADVCIPTVGSMQGSYANFMICGQVDKKKDTILFIDPGFPVQKQQIMVLGYKYETFDVYKYRGSQLSGR